MGLVHTSRSRHVSKGRGTRAVLELSHSEDNLAVIRILRSNGAPRSGEYIIRRTTLADDLWTFK